MVGEENLVRVFHGEPCLILVRKEPSNIFWSSSLEHLCEHESGKGVDAVVGKLGQIVCPLCNLLGLVAVDILG